MTEERKVPTPHGDARLVTRRAKHPVAAVVLSHGAGRGIDSPDLLAIARKLPTHDISSYLVEQPWVAAGRKVAPRPEVLDEALLAVCDNLRMRSPLILLGRSAGARSSVRLARRVGAVGVVALSFPLHPPGSPEKSRVAELTGARVPTLVIQGERDPFGAPSEFPPGTDLVVVPGADHGLATPGSKRQVAPETQELLARTVREWVQRLVAR